MSRRERPILFSGSMVRALLAGTKTQTRRVIKGICQAEWNTACQAEDGSWVFWWSLHRDEDPRTRQMRLDSFTKQAYPEGGGFICPYGVPGDRLWVRETFCYVDPAAAHPYGGWELYDPQKPTRTVAHREGCWDDWPKSHPATVSPWKPSIHMPRWASRIELEITGVRVERLQDISEEDARAEGVEMATVNAASPLHSEIKFITPGVPMVSAAGDKDDYAPAHNSAREAFACLWDSINGKKHPWESNPWVWVIEFERIRP